MANQTSDGVIDAIGGHGPYCFDLGVKAATAVFTGSLCTQLTASGFVVPYSTAAAGVVVGVAQFTADNTAAGAADGDKRVRLECFRAFAFTNGTSADAFSEATLIGSVVFGTDDTTVAKTSSGATRKPVGFFMGMELDGKVRVYVNPCLAAIVNVLQSLTDTPATADALRDNIVAAFG